ncbi:hypothetical protein [Erythrobacter dokdonensis]|uniref:Lipoprotein n=1 Tax=Erythrobacter dokdonensis DSW-74 TaxID=1300349 RepID=A0A1A7BLY0_9SPHN|nr:hypothetical protein [Erythrobacter dokdonensis]OBV12165.1 hypothetical protein I603_0296 [Erythrobacter dokdonensis DSW-74]
MRGTAIGTALLGAIVLAGCAQPDAAAPAAEEAIERPDQAPAVAASDDLMRLTCADFLATAEIARTQPADDAALAAQDEIANGLTWLHGYLYASRAGEIDPRSQDWMAATAKRVYETCSTAEKPAETSLFEVAGS